MLQLMLDTPLPQFILPEKMARQGQRIKGILPVSKMKRMEGLLVDFSDIIQIDLHFSIDSENRKTVTGSISGRVQMSCQRCLAPAPVDLDISVCLACISTEGEADSLPGQYEPLVIFNAEMPLITLVEEELLLNLPIIAYHNTECGSECNVFLEEEALNTDAFLKNEATGTRKNAFAVLEKLRF